MNEANRIRNHSLDIFSGGGHFIDVYDQCYENQAIRTSKEPNFIGLHVECVECERERGKLYTIIQTMRGWAGANANEKKTPITDQFLDILI